MDEEIRNLMKRRMKELGIKNEAELIKKSKVSQATVNRLLGDSNYNPSYKTLIKILDVLEIPCLSDYPHKLDIMIVSQLKDLDEERKNIILSTLSGLKKLSKAI